jgi:hypothetical protein
LITRLAAHFGVTVAYLVGEQPNEEEAGLVALYRDLRDLDEPDRDTIKMIMQRLREKKGGG